MKPMFARSICRALAASIIVLPLHAQAGLIGTGQAVSAALAGFVDRAEVAGQLQGLGLSPQAARERVAALTDAEAAPLADRLDSLPAGQGLGFIVVLGFLFWHFVLSEPAQAETAKPKPKPTPEKK